MVMDKPLVRVVWVDAADPASDNVWYTDAEVETFSDNTCEVVSVGYVKSKTKLYVTLVADYIINNDNDTITWGRPTKIPIGVVQSITELTS